jgi:hypothetical protein
LYTESPKQTEERYTLGVRVARSIKARVEEAARTDHRSVSSWLRNLIDRSLAEHERAARKSRRKDRDY